MSTCSEYAENKSPSVNSTPIKFPIESPHSTRSPRSPRFENLLWALRDVLIEDPDDQPAPKFMDQDAKATLVNISWSAGSAAFVNESTSGPEEKYSPSSSSISDTNVRLFDDRQSFVNNSQTHDNISINTVSSSPAAESESLLTRDDFPPPVEISHLELANFAPASTDMTECIDDDMGTSHPPIPLALSPPQSSLTSTQISPFGSPSERVLSPCITPFIRQHLTLPGGESDIESTHDSDLDSPKLHPIPTAGQVAPAIPGAFFNVFTDRSNGQEVVENVSDQIEHRTEEKAKGDAAKEDTIVQEKKGEERIADKGREGVSFGSEIERLYFEGDDMANYNDTRNPSRPEVHTSISHFRCTSSRDLCSSRIESFRQTDTGSSVISDVQVSRSTQSDAEYVKPTNQRCSTTPEAPLLTSRMFFHKQETQAILPSTTQESSTAPHTSSASVPVEQKEPVLIGNKFNVSEGIRLAYPGFPKDTQPGEGGPLTSLYEAYSDFSSSPRPESASSVEVRDYRSIDVTPEESSSISTPLSFTQERVFTPSSGDGPNHIMYNDSLLLSSPLHSQHSYSTSSYVNGIGHLNDEPKGQDIIRSSSHPVSSTSLGRDRSRKVPLGWRNSLASVSKSLFRRSE